MISHPAFGYLHPTSDHLHAERPERLQHLLAHFPDFVEGTRATREQIERVHASHYVETVELLDQEVWLDPDTYAGPTTWEAACLAAGCAIEAVKQEGFALVRPPGHHALRASAMGFCIFSNVAVAVRYAQQEAGCDRVAVVDFDVHHGNGTEALFRDDPSVFFVSLHQWPFWPGTGGPGTSDAYTLNIPLAAGSGDEDYLAAFEEKVEPAAQAFDADFVLVSAGFDAHLADPLAQMAVTAQGFRELARRCSTLGPKTAAVLEGGYNLKTLPSLVASALGGFSER